MNATYREDQGDWDEPGMTPGRAEGDDPDSAVATQPGQVANPDSDRPDYDYPDPGRTPGRAEG